MEEIRLNKLMSDSGLCSRREADKFIEMGRVTVNGKQPQVGQKVTENDEVLVDGEPIKVGKYSSSGTIREQPVRLRIWLWAPRKTDQKAAVLKIRETEAKTKLALPIMEKIKVADVNIMQNTTNMLPPVALPKNEKPKEANRKLIKTKHYAKPCSLSLANR